MTRDEFFAKLNEHGIDKSVVLFDSTPKDGYCIRKNYFRWEVAFRERGKECNAVGFASESDALQYLCEELIKDRSI